MLRLLPPGARSGEWIGALCVPDDLYWLARAPVPLVGMSYPGRADWSQLHSLGIEHVVCLTHDAPPYDPAPCTVTAVRLADLFDGRPPADPARERAAVTRAVDAVVERVTSGSGVAVHCHGGRGRAGTVLGGALVRLGHAPGDVVAYLDRVAIARGRRGWPESPWQAEVVRSYGSCIRSTAQVPRAEP